MLLAHRLQLQGQPQIRAAHARTVFPLPMRMSATEKPPTSGCLGSQAARFNLDFLQTTRALRWTGRKRSSARVPIRGKHPQPSATTATATATARNIAVATKGWGGPQSTPVRCPPEFLTSSIRARPSWKDSRDEENDLYGRADHGRTEGIRGGSGNSQPCLATRCLGGAALQQEVETWRAGRLY